MLKHTFFFIVTNLVVLSGNAQQLPQYSQYLRNQFMVNPASAGVYDFVDVTFSGRMQWVGFNNSPLTSYASICSPLNKREKVRYNPPIPISSGPIKNPEVGVGKLKHAVGGQLLFDQYGAFQRMNLTGTYAVHVPLSDNFNLSLGVRAGFSNNTFLKDKAVVADVAKDNTYNEYVSSQLNSGRIDIGSGLYLYSKKSFLGIAADNLSRDMVVFGNGLVNFDTKMHFNITGGLKFMLNSDVSLTPAFLIKYMTPSPVSIEGSLQLEYKERFWGAVSYRVNDAIIGMVGLNISEKFKFGYSYDFSISKFDNYSNGGHELVLGFMIGR